MEVVNRLAAGVLHLDLKLAQPPLILQILERLLALELHLDGKLLGYLGLELPLVMRRGSRAIVLMVCAARGEPEEGYEQKQKGEG
ncbi:MAG TPA: hypothetical protein VJ866_15795 [Pyrinomonadaceae bacterium]|nr:hypothetical protein [Pyrinomonadaceae bacterium]